MREIALICVLVFTATDLAAQSDTVVALDKFAVTGSYLPTVTAKPAITLRRRADHVAVAIELGCDLKKAEDRIAELQRAVQLVLEAAAKTGAIRATRGQIKLTSQNRTKLFGNAGSETESTAEIVLLGNLSEGASVYQRTAQIKTLLNSAGLGEKIRIGFGSTGLGVDNPGQYRGEILKKVAADVAVVREAFGREASFELEGVDGLVNVAQVDEENVDLFINYRYSLKLLK